VSWTYQYAAQTVSLLDYCTAVTVVDESGGGKVGADLDVAYMDGQRWVEKTYGPMIIPLKTILRYTDKNGLVNHTNGSAGHVYENLHALKLLFEAPGLKYLTRTDPHAGAVRAEFELAGEPVLGEMRHIFIWPLRVPSGSWQDASESSATGNPPTITTKGTRRIHDPVLVFPAAATISYTAGDGTKYEVSVSAGPTFPVTIQNVNGEWIATDNAGNDAWPYVDTTHPAVMRLDPASSISLTTTGTVTVKWRNRWA